MNKQMQRHGELEQALRQASLDDLDAIMRIEKKAFEPGIRESRAVFASRIKAFAKGFMVLEERGKVVGYVSMAILYRQPTLAAYDFTLNKPMSKSTMIPIVKRVLYISSMGVLPKYRGRGFGKLLFATAMRTARVMKCSSAVLIVGSEWKDAQGIYRKNGFKRGGVRKGFFCPKHRKPFDGIVMSKVFLP